MPTRLNEKQRERAARRAGDGADLMIWFDDQGRFLAREADARRAIKRLRECGYEVTGVRTFTKRSRVGERIRAGQARVKAAGTHVGRPRIDSERVKQVQVLLDQGLSRRAIVSALHIGRGTVARINKAANGRAVGAWE
jgi:hypothetical protein